MSTEVVMFLSCYISIIRYTKDPVRLGYLRGNRFSIVLRYVYAYRLYITAVYRNNSMSGKATKLIKVMRKIELHHLNELFRASSVIWFRFVVFTNIGFWEKSHEVGSCYFFRNVLGSNEEIEKAMSFLELIKK